VAHGGGCEPDVVPVPAVASQQHAVHRLLIDADQASLPTPEHAL
jgi:hypothetical protein